MVLAGTGNGAAALYNVLLIQRGVPDAYRGRAFTIAMSVTYAILGPAMAAAGVVTNALGGRWIWGIGAACSVLAGLVAIALAPRLRTAPAVTESELERRGGCALGERAAVIRRESGGSAHSASDGRAATWLYAIDA